MSIFQLARFEKHLKWLALGLGVASTLSIVFDHQLYAMAFSLPFCIIWIYCAWLHNEVQLKYVNILFTGFYVFGLARYFIVN
ncbi:MAG: peptidase [Pseudomonadota bacterium]